MHTIMKVVKEPEPEMDELDRKMLAEGWIGLRPLTPQERNQVCREGRQGKKSKKQQQTESQSQSK